MLTKALTVAKLCFWLVATAALLPIAYESWHQRAQFESDARRVSALIARTEQTLQSMDKGAKTWEQASKAQAAESTAVLLETKETLAKVQLLVKDSDATLITLRSATISAIEHQDQSLLETQTQLRQSLSEMTLATSQLQKTLADADKTISDPKIQESIANLADATHNAADATEHLAGTTKKVEEGVTYEVDQIKKPVTKVKAIFGVALTVFRKLFL